MPADDSAPPAAEPRNPSDENRRVAADLARRIQTLREALPLDAPMALIFRVEGDER